MFYSDLWACRKRAGGVAVKTWIFLIFGNFRTTRGTWDKHFGNLCTCISWGGGTDAHHLIRAPSEPSVIIGVIEPKGERRKTVGQLETRHRDHLINNDST